MNKVLDLSKSVYELCTEDPEIVDILKELGFENITSKMMLNTVGRKMTIPKGAVMKGLDLGKIKEVFASRGYSIKD